MPLCKGLQADSHSSGRETGGHKKSAGVTSAWVKKHLLECLSACLFGMTLMSPRLPALRAAGLVSKSFNVTCVLRQYIGGFPPPGMVRHPVVVHTAVKNITHVGCACGLSRRVSDLTMRAQLLAPAGEQLVSVSRKRLEGTGKLPVLPGKFDGVGTALPAFVGLAQ